MTSPDPDAVRAAVELFKVLGNPQRLAILRALDGAERSVGDLAKLMGSTLTVASQNLAILRRLQIVAGRDDGRMTYYRLIDGSVGDLARRCLEHCNQSQAQRRHREYMR